MTEITVSTRVTSEMITRLDAYGDKGAGAKRATVVRAAIERGLPLLEAEANHALQNLSTLLGQAIEEWAAANVDDVFHHLDLFRGVAKRDKDAGAYPPDVAQRLEALFALIPETGFPFIKKHFRDAEDGRYQESQVVGALVSLFELVTLGGTEER